MAELKHSGYSSIVKTSFSCRKPNIKSIFLVQRIQRTIFKLDCSNCLQLNYGATDTTVDRSIWENAARELLDNDLLEISRRVTQRMRLRSLASVLKIPTHVVETELENYRDNIYEAAYRVLLDWFKDRIDKKEAFKKLCQALTQIRESSLITDILIKQ